jgi:hypothetical protein
MVKKLQLNWPVLFFLYEASEEYIIFHLYIICYV